jgi:hypothetical protein
MAGHVCRWRMRLREPVLDGLRRLAQCCVQQRPVMRGVLQDHVRPRGGAVLVQAWRGGHRLCHQLLPAQLGPAQRQRRLMQPTAPALRHVPTGVGAHRRLPQRHHPRPLPKYYIYIYIIHHLW